MPNYLPSLQISQVLPSATTGTFQTSLWPSEQDRPMLARHGESDIGSERAPDSEIFQRDISPHNLSWRSAELIGRLPTEPMPRVQQSSLYTVRASISPQQGSYSRPHCPKASSGGFIKKVEHDEHCKNVDESQKEAWNGCRNDRHNN